jgi:hypothetical protein
MDIKIALFMLTVLLECLLGFFLVTVLLLGASKKNQKEDPY